jgi:hypothetical protein
VTACADLNIAEARYVSPKHAECRRTAAALLYFAAVNLTGGYQDDQGLFIRARSVTR